MSTSRSLKKPPESALHAPFTAAVRAKAKKIAAAYQVTMWFEDGEYYGRGVELPFTAADGKTVQECYENVREALEGTVALMLERHESPPVPRSATALATKA